LKRIVIVSDTQLPYEDKRALRNVITFIGDYKPDQVIQIGDLVDYPTPSRWNANTRHEFEQRVVSDSEYTKRNFFEPLRKVFDGPVGVLEGNHDERPRVYLEKNAPALAEFAPTLHFRELCDFHGFGVELLPAFHQIGPRTVVIHGHEIKGMSQIAGTTAYNHARKAGANLIMGHTHRLGVRREPTGNAATGRELLWGFEVGCLMDPQRAQYLGPGAVANWQTGFGIAYVGQYDVSPVAVDIRKDGSFVVEGARYGALRRARGGKFAKAA
jgi:predicted phosphodiesterase